MELLAKFVNDEITRTRTHSQRENDRHFKLVSSREIWMWIAERLEISLNVKATIVAAYKSVRVNVRMRSMKFSRNLTDDPVGPKSQEALAAQVSFLPD